MIHPLPLAISSVASLAVTLASASQSAPVPGPQSTVKPGSGSESVVEPATGGEAGFGAVRTPKLIKRVGGRQDASIQVVDGVYRFEQAMIESPLPDGYPEPTPFGAIDIKEYPSVRRAELTSKDDSGAGMVTGFFPLFNHIKKRDIPMTAPVEMDYPGLYTDFMKDEPGAAGETTMSFLYRSATQGPVGEDGNIVVRDAAPVTVLSVGAKGAFDAAQEFDTLRTWLKSQQEWEVAGDPRMFVYNGPFIDPEWRWSEVQVPVRRRGEASKTVPAEAPTAAPAPAASAPSAEKPGK